MLSRRLSILSRRFSTTAAGAKCNVAIVGSGPSAYYCADFLLKGDPDVHVDLYERLPVPFGLVRYGVAPDHQTVKNVTERFGQISSDPRCNLLANVRIGPASDSRWPEAASLPLSDLRAQYDAVVLAYGADNDRTLGVPGEELGGVHGARQFVEWYNGHPDAVERDFHLKSTETAVIVGHGNVALDCARMLCATPEQLVGSTDVAAHAAAKLSESGVRQVVLLGRRGVLHAAFTIKELRELSKMAGSELKLVAPADAFNKTVMAAAKADRPRKRLIELMEKMPLVEETPVPVPAGAGSDKDICVQFQRVPVGFVGGEDGRISAVTLQKTALEGAPSAKQQASLIEGSEYNLPCQLALRAVGYRSSPLEGAPFDDKRGIIPSANGGRVEDPSGAPLYVTGWLKRGPSGVILTNVTDAEETAKALLSDKADGKLGGGGGGGGEAVREALSTQGKPVLGFDDWLKIDKVEVERGAAVGKVREKIVVKQEMIRTAGG